MIAWVCYSILIAAVVAAAGRAAEWLARLSGNSVRWVWVGALALTAFLSGSALVRELRDTPAGPQIPAGVETRAAYKIADHMSWAQAVRARMEIVRRAIDRPIEGAAATLRRTIAPVANVYAGFATSLTSLAILLAVAGVGVRFRRARRGWPVVRLEGYRVRLASNVGPVVIGFARPEIVVPRWLLAREPDEQRLVVTHENEHIRARDPQLLGLAWVAVVFMPWNPAVWYILSRLRLAVELDCDARVLRRGAPPRSYGSLLIDVAQQASALRLSALALADDSSHLHQRILAMKPIVPRFARLRGGLAAAFACTSVVVACQATLPTDAEIERMDVATATKTARDLAQLKRADTAVTYTIDGMKATATEALALAPSVVDRVEIVSGKVGTPTSINVRKRTNMLDKIVKTDTLRIAQAVPDSVSTKVEGRGRRGGPMLNLNTLGSGTPVVFIDGVRSTQAQLKALNPNDIESVEVIKGAAAAQQYGPEGMTGVITIKTKRGG